MLSAALRAGGEASQERMTSANERVRARIEEWVKAEGHGSQRRLAEAVLGKFGEHKSDQWISDIIHRRADVPLRLLDPIARAMGYDPGWLTRGTERNYEECTMAESKLLKHFRRMPDTVRQAALLCLDYFAMLQDAHGTTNIRQRTVKTTRARASEHPRARKQKPS